MKILFLLTALANIVLFMWEYKHGAFERGVNIPQQLSGERILLVSELKSDPATSNEPVADVDFTALYPPGLDPLADNMLTEPAIIEDFTDELLFSAEPHNGKIN